MDFRISFWGWAAAACLAAGCHPPASEAAAPRAASPLPAAAVASRSCSNAIESFLAALKRPVEATMLVPKNGSRDADASDTEKVMVRLSAVSHGNLKYIGREPVDAANSSESPSSRTQLKVVLQSGSSAEVVLVLDPKNVERYLLVRIGATVDGALGVRHRLGVVEGAPGLRLRDGNLVRPRPEATMLEVMTKAFPLFQFEPVDPEKDIDGSLEGLFVLQPAATLSPRALKRIDELVVAKQRPMAVYASAVDVDRDGMAMHATFDAHGLDALLAGYGVEMKADVVLDGSSDFRYRVAAADGSLRWLHAPAILVVPGARLHGDMVDRLDELAFPFASSLVVHPERQPGARIHAVARTSDGSWATTGPDVRLGIGIEWKPASNQGSKIVAVSVEGSIKSAFGGASSNPRARILVFSASQFLANPFVRATFDRPQAPAKDLDVLAFLSKAYAESHLTSMILSFRSTLDWMLPAIEPCDC